MRGLPALVSLALAGALLMPAAIGQQAGADPRPAGAGPAAVAPVATKSAAKHVVRPTLHRPSAPTAMVPGAATVSWRHQGKQTTLTPTGFANSRPAAVPTGHRTLKPTVTTASAPAPGTPVPVVRAPDWNLQQPDSVGNSAASSVGYLPSGSKPVDVVFGGFGRIGRVIQPWNTTLLWDGTSWTSYTGGTAPAARGGAMMAYDAALGKLVLFGGWDGTSFYSDTWTFDGTSWTQLSPASSPGPLAFGSMAYDATLGKLVLFGGASTVGAAPAFRLAGGSPTGTPTLSNATWTFDGTSWVQLSSTGAPPARMSTAFGYDQDAGNDVLFGGYGSSGTLADTWRFTGTGWTQLTPVNAPTGVSDAAMAWDGTLHSLVLFGGQTGTGSMTNTTSLWDSAHQSWQWASDDVAAASRIDAGLAPAAVNGQLMLWGGKTSTGDYSSTMFLYDWGRRGSATGDQTDQFTLSDRASLAVDIGSGNAYLRQDGLDVAGTGVNLETFAQYNSQVSGGVTDSVWPLTLHYGPHGSMEVDGVGGSDDNMPFYADGSGGFTSPPGVNATLQYVSASSGYELIVNPPSQQIYWFNAPADDGSGNPGVITALTDHSGNTISISGSTSTGNVTVVDTHGRTVTRTVSGGTATWTLPDGRTWSESAISGGWQTLTDIDGATVQLGYGGPNGALSNIIDAAGNQLQLSYDSYQRVTGVTRLDTGATTNYDWSPAGPGVAGADLQVQRTDPAGHVAVDTNAYDGQTLATVDPVGSTGAATYNSDLAPVTQTDALGNTATASYAAGDPTVQTGATAPPTASGQTPAATSATYNTPTSVLGHQNLPSSTTDSQGNCTAKVYDAAGLVTDVYAGQGAPCDGLTGGVHTATRYQGDPGVPSCGAPAGQVCSKTDGNGAVTSYSYDTAGNLATVTPPAPLQPTSYTYDGSSRPATVTDASGVRTISYDNADRVLQIRYGGATSCVPSAGSCVSYGYDADGNRTQQVDQSGTTSWSYDAANRLVKEIPPNAPVNSCSTPNDGGILYSYDDAGNLVSMCSASGTTNYGYDRVGKLLTIGAPIAQVGVRKAGSTPGGTSLPLPGGVRAGDLILVQVAQMSTPTAPTGYSLVSTVGTVWTEQFVYSKTATATDTSFTVPAGGANSVLIAVYRGVDASSPIEAISTGEQDSWASSLTLAGVTTTAASDRLLLFGMVRNSSYAVDGGLTVEQQNTDSVNYQFVAGQALTAAGATGSRTISGTSAMYSGILLALKPADTISVPTTHTYDANGNALTTRYPGGTTQHMTYNGSGRLNSIDAVDGSGTTLFDYQVSWAHGVNDRNQRQSTTETVSGRTTAYSYDRLGRLTEAQDTAGGTEDYRYTYDGAGNIVQQVVNGVTTSAGVNAADELCWTVTAASTNGCTSPPSGATSYSYDGNGSLTGNSAYFSATENALNQTTNMGTGGRSSWSMAYSGADQTVRTQAGQHTFVNAQDRVLTDTSSGTVASYTTEPQGALVSQQLASATYYYLYDAMGNVVGLVDGSGVRQATYRYTPYGATLTATGTAAGSNPYRFGGGYWDNTGFYHFGARYYDPALGRWTQPDPSAQDPGYVYAGDDPINSADPTGLTNNANGHSCHWWGCDFRMSNDRARVLADRINEAAGTATMCAALAGFIAFLTGVGGVVAFICGFIAGAAWYYASRISELVDRYGRGIFFRVHWWGDVSLNHQ